MSFNDVLMDVCLPLQKEHFTDRHFKQSTVWEKNYKIFILDDTDMKDL